VTVATASAGVSEPHGRVSRENASHRWVLARQGSLREAQGRHFDSAMPSLREDIATLRMTGFFDGRSKVTSGLSPISWEKQFAALKRCAAQKRVESVGAGKPFSLLPDPVDASLGAGVIFWPCGGSVP